MKVPTLTTSIKSIVLSFVFILVLDPSGIMFRLKEIALVIIFALYAVILSIRAEKLVVLNSYLVALFVISFPVVSLLLSFVFQRPFQFSDWLPFFKSHIVILFLLPIVDVKIEIKKMLLFSTVVVAILTICSYILANFSKELFDQIYNLFVVKYQNGMFAIRHFMGIQLLSVFYKTSPLLLLSFPIFFSRYLFSNERKLLNFSLSAITLAGLFVTGTRAPMLGGAILFLFFLGKYIFSKVSKLLAILILLTTTVFVSATILVLASEKSEKSNIIKYGNLVSYEESFSNMKTVVLGDGVGSKIYFRGTKEFATFTELTYLDIYRMYGVILGSFLILIFLYPGYYLVRFSKGENQITGYAFLLYLMVAGTNPLLISSTGMLVLCYVYSLVIKRN